MNANSGVDSLDLQLLDLRVDQKWLRIFVGFMMKWQTHWSLRNNAEQVAEGCLFFTRSCHVKQLMCPLLAVLTTPLE